MKNPLVKVLGNANNFAYVLISNEGNFIRTFATKKEAFKESLEWKCTDPNQDQWVRKISNDNFEVFEQGEIQNIYLKDYSGEQIRELISAYYDSLEELIELYGKDSNQIIAECIAEQK
jgi:hypothetical protein